jgi:type I restriction enzyme S subunit
MSREMKDSGVEWIGEIPKKWKISKVKYFVKCFDGKRIPIDIGERKPGPYPYWGAGSITDYVENYIFDEELILLGEDGAPFFDYTRPVAFLVNEKIWVNNHIHVLKPSKTISSLFLTFFLNAVDYKTYINGSILNKLTQNNMKNITIVLPTFEEQYKIARLLNEKCEKIDSIIKKSLVLIDEYRLMKQSVITKAVTQGIRSSRLMKKCNITWLREIPDEWTTQRGKHLFVETNERSVTGEEELLTVSHITGVTPRKNKNVNMFMSESLVDYKICHEGDIAANTMWMWQGAIGVSKYYGVISPSYNTYRQKTDTYDADYLEYLLRISPLVATYAAYSTGITASRLRLYPQGFFSILFPVPPRKEQQEIAVYLNKKIPQIDQLIIKKEKFVDELKSYKRSLIYEYVTGKKEVPES